MNEFLTLNWRTKELSELEPQRCFITEDVIGDSLVYKIIQNKSIFYNNGKKTRIFEEKVYTPGGTFSTVTLTKSLLDEWAHEQCLKALKVFQSGKDLSCFNANDQFSIDIFKKLKPKIIQENSNYEAYVLDKWNTKDKSKLLRIKSGIFLFGKQTWEEKWKKIVLYPQFYKEISTFNMNFNKDESIVDFICTNNVLELGTLARFSNPNLKSVCHLKCVTLPLDGENKCVYSNLPVSQDQNISNILQNSDFDLVISSSGLKCITDTSDVKSKWMIPVVVKAMDIKKENGTTVSKNVVYLDKPFAQNDISKVDLACMSFKRLIKTNFCQFEAFDYGNEDSTLANVDLPDYKSAFVDLKSGPDRPTNRHHNKIHHNVSYRIWNIKKTDCQNNLMKNKNKTAEFNVLIRSKLDACECNEQGALQPVILRPKLEMQLSYGANIPSKSELAREWTSLFFTPFSNLYRVRLAPISGEVICVEKCNIQKVAAEAQTHYKYKPQLSLGILQKVFEELINLEPGKYLLQHLPKHEAFVAILKASEDGACNQDIFDFYAEYDKVMLEDLPKNWLPIDVNYILPSFDAIKRMPGMFTPRKIENGGKKKKKGGLRKITKKKSKE